jgi:prepilin-type N-terminal cleavage/methylation domain-containing protein
MRKSAFNLVEILVAMAILTIGMVGLVGIIPVSTEALSSANGKLYASEIGQFMGDYAAADIGYVSPAATPTNLTISTDPANLFTNSTPAAGASAVNLAPYKISRTSINGIFSIQRTSSVNGGSVVDFTAYACIWQDTVDKALLKIDINWPGVPGKDKPINNRAAGRSITFYRNLNK